MQDSPFVLGFTAGELSPWLATRFDLQAYHRGAALLQNFLVMPYGGVRRRCGTEFVAMAATQVPEAGRLVPFYFSESDSLMLELYPGRMRVFRNGQCVCREDGSIYELSTPWASAAEVQSLHCTQVNDVVYVTSAYRRPHVLSRYGDAEWYCREFSPEPFPRETYRQQPDGLSVQVDSNGYTALLTLSGESYRFTPEMVDCEYVIADAETPARTLFLNQDFVVDSKELPSLQSHEVLADYVWTVYDADSKMYNFYTVIKPYKPEYFNGSTSPSQYPEYFFPGAMRLENGRPYEVCGDWEIRTGGEWDAVWELWRSYDNSSVDLDFRRWHWSRIRTFEQNSFSERKNYLISGSEDYPCRMMLVCRSASSATSPGAHVYFNILGGEREMKYIIRQYISPTQVKGRLVSEYEEQARSFFTRKWSFGAYGARCGYPTFSGLHQGRLWFGGFAGMPTTLIASAVNNYADFHVDSVEDSALHLTLATDNQSRICWICPARNLLVGTTESEWTLSGGDGGTISPMNASFVRQSSVGSEVMDARSVENTVFYVQRGGKRLREISYKLTADGFTSTDTSLLAEHLFAGGVRAYAVQRGTDTRLWVLMHNGTLAVLTTNAEQQVTAWQRVALQGRRILQLATLPSRVGGEDEVWFIVLNESSACCSIERISSLSAFLDGAVCAQCDSATVSAGEHLAGLSGFVCPTGQAELAQPVSFGENGSFSIPDFVQGMSYTFGAGFVSELHTMPLENERSYNTVRQEGRVRLRVLESSPDFDYKGTQAAEWEQYEPARDALSFPHSGDIRVSQLPEPGVGQGFALRVNGALDFRLLSLTVEFDFHGR